jgi:hypothetical protein
MDNMISIHLFCQSLGSRLRLWLRLVKVLLEYGLPGTVGLAGLDGAVLVLRLLLKAGYIEKA